MQKIRLRYYRSKNFGDNINPWLVELISGVKNIKPEGLSPPLFFRLGGVYMVIGSILEFADKRSTIWGPGFISEKGVLKQKPKKVHAVRGPLSRKKLLEQGVMCPEIYGDPALLLPRFYHPNVKKKYNLGIIPHYVDKDSPWLTKLKKRKDVSVIDVEGNKEDVIKNILSCKKIASSSLHGIITADAYNIPSSWIEFSDKVVGKGFKFRDYFASVGRKDKAPLRITEKTTLKDVYNSFHKYKIKIDLDKLLDACPFKK